MVEWIHPQGPQVGFPWCNNADIECNMRIPTGPTLVHPKVEKLLGQYKEENTSTKVMIPVTDTQLPH